MANKENSNYQNYLRPVIVLLVITLLTTLALAATHTVANPVIIQNQIQADNETRAFVLPEGDGFTEYDGTLVDGVSACYIADNGAGMVVTAAAKGFSGDVTAMVGLDANGAVTGVSVTNHGETPGLGTKAMTVEYLAQYIGNNSAAAGHIKDDPDVEAISGATYSSNAIYGDVVLAIKQFAECGGVK